MPIKSLSGAIAAILTIANPMKDYFARESSAKLLGEELGLPVRFKRRAKPGGEIGVNGYFYPGGAFLPSREDRLPGSNALAGGGGGKVEIEPWKRVDPKPGYKPIYQSFWPGVMVGKMDNGLWGVIASNHTLSYYFGDESEQYRTELQALADRYNRGERWLKVDDPSAVVTEDMAEPIQADTSQPLTIIEHTTARGKVIRGVVRKDISGNQASEIDPYTFRKDGGWFIREKHLEAMAGVQVNPAAASVEQAVQKAPEQTEEQKQAIAREQAAARQEQARMKAADRLRAVADKMLADAESELGRDRNTNTARRARMAGSAIREASHNSAIAKTIGNLADAIAAGQADKLAGLTSRTQVEMLDSLLKQAQYDRWRSEGKNYAETERLKGEPLTERDIDYVKFPQVSIHRNHASDIASALAGKKGYTKASAWAYSKSSKSSEWGGVYFLDPSEIDMARTVLKGLDVLGKKQMGWSLTDGLTRVDRMNRMGIKNTNDLHAALKEYLQFRDGGIKEDPVKAAERKLVGQKVGIDFFPTPKSLAQRMVELAGIKKGDRVLEPSAGSGNIADAAKTAGADVDTIEVSSQLRELLGLKGHNLIGHDFEVEDYTGRYYDAVLMNPPFSDRKDALHIMRAFDLLKKGGTLVAIAGEGVFFGSDAKAVGFREWLKEHRAHIEKLPEGTFLDKSLLATTGANARLIVMTRRTATGEVTSDDHLQDAGGAVAKEPMTYREFSDDSIAIPAVPDADAWELAKEVMSGRFEESNDDTTEMNKRAMAAGIPRMLTFVTDKALGNRSLISIVADQNLRDAPTEKIQVRIDAITKKISQSMEKTVSDFDPSTLGGSGAAGRQRDRARASEARGIMGEYVKRLQDELDRRGVKSAPQPDPGFSLTTQTEEELRAKEAADKAAQAKEEQERLAAERKAQADREAADFKLTGSDRPADVAVAAGQGDLFAPKTRGQKEAEKNLPKSEATISDADYAQVVEAARYLKDIVYSLDNLVGDDQRLLVALSSELGKSGRDTILMDAFGIDRNLAHTIHNRMDDSKPHKLRDIDMTDAFDTFPMLKKIIDDAKEELRLRDERKAAKEAKNATITDDMDPNSPNYRYRDTGYVAATRKELAQSQIRAAREAGQQVTMQSIDWDAIEENPRVAKELIVKSNLFGKVDWDALKSAGLTPEAGFLIDRVYASIAPEPTGEGAQTRRNYVLALQSLRERLESCKTVDQVLEVLEEVRNELTGYQLNSDEEAAYQELYGQYRAVLNERMELDKQKEGPANEWQAARMEWNKQEWEQNKRARRGWKPDPVLDEKAAAAKKKADDTHAVYMQIFEANKPRIEELRKSEDVMWKQLNSIKESARRRNLLESPATLGWLTFGKRFFDLLHWRRSSGSEAFAGHVVNAKAGRVGGWDWSEKERSKPVKQATKQEVKFRLKVAERFERRGGKPVTVKTTQDLKDAFGLREIVSGNWVLKDPLSAKFHVEQASGALNDMGDILGIAPSALGLGGRLAMAFGAYGKGNAGFGGAAAATYEPTHRVINLTKMQGGGALGHEYFHALDNLIHEMVTGKVAEEKGLFVTENPSLLPAGALSDAVASLRDAMTTGNERLTELFALKPDDKRWANRNVDNAISGPGKAIKQAGSAEAAVRAVRAMIKPIDKRREKLLKDWLRIAVAYYSPEGSLEVSLPTGPSVSSFKKEAVILDSGAIGKYWSSSSEMASRAFQAYLEDKLASADRRNDYLSSFADNKYHVDPLLGIEWKPFPEGEERKRINAAFDKLFEVIRGEQILEKAAANKPLMDAMFPGFDPDAELTDIIRQMVA